MKRIFDFTFAVFGIFVSFPCWIIFSFLIWLKDGKNIFYVQDRVGQHGKIFKSFKFRSMIINIESLSGALQATEGDLRVTTIGRFLRIMALDELPQLWNIIKGDISFVGPRALREIEIDSLDKLPKSIWEFNGAKERSSISPGLTGVAQIFASRNIGREDKFRYDIWYIKHRDMMLDIYLIFLSFLISLFGAWEKQTDKFNFRCFKTMQKRIETEL